MASRRSSLSSISSVSSTEIRTVDFEGLLFTPADLSSTNESEHPRLDQGAAVDQVDQAVTPEPLAQRKHPVQHGEDVQDSEPEDSVETNHMQYSRRSWYHDWWFWEIAGALLSLGSTAAIIIILAVYDHQPVPVLRYGITLNAMLSVLSTIAKVSSKINAMYKLGSLGL